MFSYLKNLILGHRRASSYGSSVAAMQNMPPHTPGHHPYQMIRGHSHEQLYGHPHPGQPMYSPYYYRKWFFCKVNSVQEACAKCFVVHISKFEILQTI